jgi:hypothetical protein
MSDDDTEPELELGLGEGDAVLDGDEAGVEEGLDWVAGGEVSTGEAEGAYEMV